MKNLLLLLLLVSVYTSAQTISFPQDTIVYDNLFNNRQYAILDNSGKIHLTYTGQQGTTSSTREIYYVTINGNQASLPQNITNNNLDDNYSSLSLDSAFHLHVSFTGRDAANLFQVQYINNVSGEFSPPRLITTAGLNKAIPHGAVGKNGIMHFVYFTYTNEPDNVYYISHNYRDSVTSSPQLLTDGEVGGDFDAQIAVDKSGFVHIVVKSGGVFGGALKYYNNTSGNLIQVPTPVGINITNPKIAIDKDNIVHIVYRNEAELRLYHFTYSEGNFSTPVAVTPAGQRPSGGQHLAIDDSNRVYIMYQSSVSTSGKGFYLVYGKDNQFTDTLKVYDLTPEYVTRNSSSVVAHNNGEIALFYSPGAVRNSLVVCDIFMKRGNLFNPVPVEVTLFNAEQSAHEIALHWQTQNEFNNRGFAIERNSGVGFQQIGFVSAGTASDINNYSYIDNLPLNGLLEYRLRQIDFDGTETLYGPISVNYSQTVNTFQLLGNYPNPFNPATTIQFALPVPAPVAIEIFDISGSLVHRKELGFFEAGVNAVDFSMNEFTSGIYYYRVTAKHYSATAKMLLVK